MKPKNASKSIAHAARGSSAQQLDNNLRRIESTAQFLYFVVAIAVALGILFGLLASTKFTAADSATEWGRFYAMAAGTCVTFASLCIVAATHVASRRQHVLSFAQFNQQIADWTRQQQTQLEQNFRQAIDHHLENRYHLLIDSGRILKGEDLFAEFTQNMEADSSALLAYIKNFQDAESFDEFKKRCIELYEDKNSILWTAHRAHLEFLFGICNETMNEIKIISHEDTQSGTNSFEGLPFDISRISSYLWQQLMADEQMAAIIMRVGSENKAIPLPDKATANGIALRLGRSKKWIFDYTKTRDLLT